MPHEVKKNRLPSSSPFSQSLFTIRLFPPCVFTPFRRTIIPLKFSSLCASNSQCAWRLSLSHNVMRSFVPLQTDQFEERDRQNFSQGKERTARSNFRTTFLGFVRVMFYPSHGVISLISSSFSLTWTKTLAFGPTMAVVRRHRRTKGVTKSLNPHQPEGTAAKFLP